MDVVTAATVVLKPELLRLAGEEQDHQNHGDHWPPASPSELGGVHRVGGNVKPNITTLDGNEVWSQADTVQ